MPKPEKRKLERVQYWQGQMLHSRDFRDIEAGEAQRRWWHNRALHSAYGIVEGLNCKVVPTAAPTGVLVSPGVAYDCFGRELILEKPQTIALPPNGSSSTRTVSLLMRYKLPAGALPSDERLEVCWTSTGCVSGTAEIVWKLGDKVNPSEGVAVCAVDYTKGRIPQLNSGPHLHVPARPQSRPLLASGTTIPGNTPWDPWSAGFLFDANDNPIPNVIGVQTWVDTSAAGFTQVPCYFAWLQGSLWNSQTQQLTPAIFPSVTDESVTGFTFRLWLQVLELATPGILSERIRPRVAAAVAAGSGFSFVTDPGDFSRFAQQQGLYVSWVGCQMQAQVSCCGEQKSASSAAPTQLVVSPPKS